MAIFRAVSWPGGCKLHTHRHDYLKSLIMSLSEPFGMLHHTNFLAVEYAFKKDHDNLVNLELNGLCEVLVYADADLLV
jgi:hypothetical protein